MGDLSQHFSRSEFACHCGCGFGAGGGDISVELVRILELVRARFEAPISILSGCRCASHNRRVGGAPSSQHLLGRAADIRVHGVTPKTVADWLCERFPNDFGIGRYPTFTHFDTRIRKARWGQN